MQQYEQWMGSLAEQDQDIAASIPFEFKQEIDDYLAQGLASTLQSRITS
jgi:hypothetical protein